MDRMSIETTLPNGNGKLWGLISLALSGLGVVALTLMIFILSNISASVERLDDKLDAHQLDQVARLVAVEKDVEALQAKRNVRR